MNDEELRQAGRMLESYNAQLENLNRQMALLRSTRDETYRAGRALRAISQAEVGDEILVPVGASAFVRVKVTGKDAVCGIGNGISVEKPVSEAADKMDSDRGEVEQGINNLLATMQEIQGYVQQLSAAVQKEYAQRQAQMNQQ